MHLIENLSQIKDFRRNVGLRYPLTPLLLIIIMSIISGNTGYREIAKFAQANQNLFLKFFSKKRTKLPTHVTFREIIIGIDFNEVLTIFHQWTAQYVTIEKNEWFSIDGKALNSTVSDYDSSFQNFVSMVSIFSHKRGQVIKMAQLENKKQSEIPTVEELIQVLDLKDLTFTLDALHCQKKL
jgi:hypothetical protein